jgi:hypothetical protein
MKIPVLRFSLAGLLLASLALPALADGSPVPCPNKSSSPVLKLGERFSSAVKKTPGLVGDGLPVPWPKKAINTPAVRADGLPVPWPKKIIVQSPAVLIADGLPVPWPKK